MAETKKTSKAKEVITEESLASEEVVEEVKPKKTTKKEESGPIVIEDAAIRSVPSFSKKDIIGFVSKGDGVDIIDSNATFHKINTKTGLEGFVMKQFIKTK